MIPRTADLVIRNGTVVTAGFRFQADVVATDGTFTALAASGGPKVAGAEEIDATGLYVLPGVIDAHVHFRDPGLEYKEDWRTGSSAAALGGVTTVVDMPNTEPTTDRAAHVEEKRLIAEQQSYVDFGILGLLGRDNILQLGAMARVGVVGFKCFIGETAGNAAAPDDGMMLDALREIASTGRRVGFHAENGEILRHLRGKLESEKRIDPLAHLDSRPIVAEVESIQRMALFALETGARIHVVHLSSKQGLATVKEWRNRGVDISCETAPHYMFLEAESMKSLGSRLRVNPPVRYGSEGHREALLGGLRDGSVNMIGSDHAPHTAGEKLTDSIWTAVSGFPGVETAVRLFLTLAVNPGLISLEDYVRVSLEGPAKTWGLWPRKGAIRLGSDADLTLVDLDHVGEIHDADLHSKNAVTPYDGLRTKGAPVATIVRGRVVMRDGSLVEKARGRFVKPSGRATVGRDESPRTRQ